MRSMFNNCNSLNKVTVSNNETKTKILDQLNKDVGEWEESENKDACTLIKVEEKK